MEKDFSLKAGAVVKGKKNDYRILTCIRRDGMGYTYTAEPCNRRKDTPRKVVVREHFMPHCSERDYDGVTVMTNPDIAPTVETCLNAFKKASTDRAIISAQCPSIINVIDIFDANATYYYVVEFLDGMTFEEYVHQKGRLSWEETREQLSPILYAVKTIHTLHAMHTEINPRHIRFVSHKGQSIPVLFSLYATLHFNDEGKQLWAIPIMTCETGYAPPEQYLSIDRFSPQTDIYSLAATIVFALSGRTLPDSRETTEEVIRKILPPTLPETTVQALLHALHPDMANRTSSISDFREELREFYGGKKRELPEEDPDERPGRWHEMIYRYRLPIAIVSIAAIAAVFLSII